MSNIRTDNRTALSIFKGLRVNAQSGDLLQRALLNKMISSVLIILGEDFIKANVMFSYVPGPENLADGLTRNVYAEKIMKAISVFKPQAFDDDMEAENSETVTINSLTASVETSWLSPNVLYLINTLPAAAINNEQSSEKIQFDNLPIPSFNSEIDKNEVIYFGLPKVILDYYILKFTFNALKPRSSSLNNNFKYAVLGKKFIFEELKIDQIDLPEYSEAKNRQCVKNGSLNNFMFTENGLLVRKAFNMIQIVLPLEVAYYVVSRLHNLNHATVTALLGIIGKSFYWAKMKQTIKHIVKSCHVCQCTQRSKSNPVPVLIDDKPPSKPYDRVFVDIYGPLPPNKNCNSEEIVPRFYMTVVDSFSSRLEVIPIFGTVTSSVSLDERAGIGVSNKCVLGALLQLFAHSGIPSQIIFDHASYFLKIKPILEKRYNIDVIILPGNSPWRRGRVERPHKELNKAVRACTLLKVSSNKFRIALLLPTRQRRR